MRTIKRMSAGRFSTDDGGNRTTDSVISRPADERLVLFPPELFGAPALHMLFIMTIVYTHIRSTIILSLLTLIILKIIHVIILSKLLTSTRDIMERIIKIGGHYTTTILLSILTSIIHHVGLVR